MKGFRIASASLLVLLYLPIRSAHGFHRFVGLRSGPSCVRFFAMRISSVFGDGARSGGGFFSTMTACLSQDFNGMDDAHFSWASSLVSFGHSALLF